MPDLEVSKLPALAGADLTATDPLPLADLSASETKKITVKDLIQSGVALIDNGSIPSSKLNLTLPAGSITSTQLANKSVTASKLDDNSSTFVGSISGTAGSFIGQLAFDAPTGKLRIWDGGTWQDLKAAGSVNALTYDNSIGPVTLGGVVTGDRVQLSATLKPTTSAREFIAGPTGAGGVAGYRQIVGTDLPAATGTDLGAVKVNGDGLRISSGSVIQIANDVTASTTYGVVKYDAKGLITGGRAITSADLPVATAAAAGALYPGSGLTVTALGQLNHTNVVAAGTGAKVTFDATGHVTGTSALVPADIPDISADKLTSGTLPAGRIAARSVTAAMLADYSTALIQEAVPPAGVGSHPIGMIWLQESTGQVSVWNGNSWMKTGASTLFNRNLRYAGSYNPATGLITGVTQFGTAEGFKVNDPIPAADDKIAGVYFVASGAGASPSVAGGVTFDAGDWLLCHGTTGGWVRIDTLNGAGGGGGTVSNLDDLLDVTLTAPTQGDFLQLGSSNQWVNASVLDEGTWT